MLTRIFRDAPPDGGLSATEKKRKNSRRAKRRQFFRELPRRTILWCASGLLVVTVVRWAVGDIDAKETVIVFSTACVFVAYPFRGNVLAQVAAELIRKKYLDPKS